MLFVFSYITSIIMYAVISRVIPTNRYLAKVAFKADFCCVFSETLKQAGVALGNGIVKAQKALIAVGGSMYGIHKVHKSYSGHLDHALEMEKARQNFELKVIMLNGVVKASPDDRPSLVSAAESLGLFKVAPMEEPLIVDANKGRVANQLANFITGSLKKP